MSDTPTARHTCQDGKVYPFSLKGCGVCGDGSEDPSEPRRQPTARPELSPLLKIGDEALAWCDELSTDAGAEMPFVAYALQDVLRELDAQRAALAAAQAENICDICAGAPLASGRECACGGTGLMSRAALHIREQLLKAEAALERTQAEREARDRILTALACEHTSKTGGNDYQLCNDCGMMWDYRRGQAEGQLTALRNSAKAALTAPASAAPATREGQ